MSLLYGSLAYFRNTTVVCIHNIRSDIFVLWIYKGTVRHRYDFIP